MDEIRRSESRLQRMAHGLHSLSDPSHPNQLQISGLLSTTHSVSFLCLTNQQPHTPSTMQRFGLSERNLPNSTTHTAGWKISRHGMEKIFLSFFFLYPNQAPQGRRDARQEEDCSASLFFIFFLERNGDNK